MEPNHAYVVQICRELAPPPTPILDFGCGDGTCVIAGRDEGLNIVGIEPFTDETDYRQIAADRGLLGTSVLEVREGERLPFEDESFSLVVSNMVFEHVQDIEGALAEIARVLKPDGQFVTLFPGTECVIEGHVCIPAVHWFPVSWRLRHPYMTTLRRLGLGAGRAGRTPSQWATEQLAWIDAYTFYHSPRALRRFFKAAGFSMRNIEDDYIEFRFERRGQPTLARLSRAFPFAPLSRLFCRLYGTRVILATKQSAR